MPASAMDRVMGVGMARALLLVAVAWLVQT